MLSDSRLAAAGSGLAIVVAALAALVAYFTTLPGKPKDAQSAHGPTDEKDYLAKLYRYEKRGARGDQNPSGFVGDPEHKLVRASLLNWLWDSAPDDMRQERDVAPNLSFEWPPQQKTRFRMTAFPYPKGDSHQWWVISFVQGMASLLDNTADQATFPGWQISIYDPDDPNDNYIYNNLLPHLPWDAQGGVTPPAGSSKSGQTPQWMEVLHACYAPPSKSYPTCDDGGFWLYGTPGSGVFWNTGSRALLCDNKLTAMKMMLQSDRGFAAAKAAGLFSGCDDDLEQDTAWEDYMVAKFRGTGGGLSLVQAMRQVVLALQRHEQAPSITAFRSLERRRAYTTWGGFVTFLSLTATATLAALCGVAFAAGRSIHERRLRARSCAAAAFGAGVAAALWAVLYCVVADAMLEGFGYVTLDMAVKRRCGCGSPEDKLRQLLRDATDHSCKDLLALSLAQVQTFDFDLEVLAGACGVEAVIMCTQPNKSGSWAVEIMSVVNTPFVKGATADGDTLMYDLGICGRPIDAKAAAPAGSPGCGYSKDCMTPLRQGPIQFDARNYMGYEPTPYPSSLCNCDEAVVRSRYKEDSGDLALCTFCTAPAGTPATYSQQLCLPQT